MKKLLEILGTILGVIIIVAIACVLIVGIRLGFENVGHYFIRTFEVLGEEGLISGIGTVFRLASAKGL